MGRVERIRLQPLVRARVDSLGPSGRLGWQDFRGCSLTWRNAGRCALVAVSQAGARRTSRAHRRWMALPRVVKVIVPAPELADEARVLAAAHGRGYAILHAHDPKRRGAADGSGCTSRT